MRPTRPTRATVRGALAGGALTGALACAALAPAAHAADFYTPPDPLPAGPPGTVIRSEQVKVSKSWMKPPGGTKVWRVLYKSTSATGAPIAVSGSVLVPNRGGTRPKRPLVALAPGSQGVGDTCAPSKKTAFGGVQDFLIMNLLLYQGYAVAMTDYEGLGTPGLHTYAVNRSAAHSVLDSIRAARGFAPAGLSAEAKTFAWGYSQGGGAAGATAELQPEYAPDVKLDGVVAGGVLADPYQAGLSLDGGDYAGYLLAAAMGYDATYPELDLENFLNERGFAERGPASSLCFGGMLSTYKGSHIADFTKSNPMETPAWRARLAENALGKKAPETPVYMFHGKSDQQLPYQATWNLRKTWCSQGAKLEWKTLYGTDHVKTAIFGLPDSFRWLDDRVKGRKLTTNC